MLVVKISKKVICFELTICLVNKSPLVFSIFLIYQGWHIETFFIPLVFTFLGTYPLFLSFFKKTLVAIKTTILAKILFLKRFLRNFEGNFREMLVKMFTFLINQGRHIE